MVMITDTYHLLTDLGQNSPFFSRALKVTHSVGARIEALNEYRGVGANGQE